MLSVSRSRRRHFYRFVVRVSYCGLNFHTDTFVRMVSQAVKYIGYASPFAIAWLLIVIDVVHVCDHCKFHFIAAPVYVVAALAVGSGRRQCDSDHAHTQVYSLASVVYGVATFNDCSESVEELRAEIEQARKELAGKGMKFS